jgi:hypothetical protein
VYVVDYIQILFLIFLKFLIINFKKKSSSENVLQSDFLQVWPISMPKQIAKGERAGIHRNEKPVKPADD